MAFYPDNTDRYRSTKNANLEMCLQIIAGVRDTWTLDDAECETLGFYACDRSDDGHENLRRDPKLAKKAACSMAAFLLIDPWE